MNTNIILKGYKYLVTYKSLQIMYLNFKKGSYIDFSSMCAQKIMFNPFGCHPAVLIVTEQTQNPNLHIHNNGSDFWQDS